MTNFLDKIKEKINKNLKPEKILLVDNSNLHKKHKLFDAGKFNLKLIIKSKKLKIKYLHFGGGRTNDENDSLLKFKKSFSNKETEFFIGEKIYNKILYNQLTIASDKKMFYSYRNDDFIS